MSRAVIGTLLAVTFVAWLAACGAPLPPTAPDRNDAADASSPVVEPTPAQARAQAKAETTDAALPPLPPPSLGHLLPTAHGVVVFEIARMRRFEMRPLARAFVLELVALDLLEVDKTCDLDPVETVHRLVLSGSLDNDRVLAAFDLEVPPARVLDCLAKVYPQARAQEVLGHPVLELGHEHLLVTERNGVLLMAERIALVEALGGEPTEPTPPMIDGLSVGELRLGDVNEALSLLSGDPNRLIAVGNHGQGSGFIRVPTVSITFAFDGERLSVEGDIDLSGESGRENTERIRRQLSRSIGREMVEVTGDASLAEPLLRAVDDARIALKDGHLVFSGSTAALDVVERLVNGVAEKEIERELKRRELGDKATVASPLKPGDIR